MLDNLLIAVESEAQIVDIGRVSGFMQKVQASAFARFISPNECVSGQKRCDMMGSACGDVDDDFTLWMFSSYLCTLLIAMYHTPHA